MPPQNMDDFVMKLKWTILLMWTILLEYTGIGPTLYIESTLWYPSSREKAYKLLSEDWLWMNYSWKSSFWSRKLFLEIHVRTWSVLTTLFYQPGILWTTDQQTQMPSLKQREKNCYFYALYKVGQSSMFLHSSSHYKSYYVHVDEISNFSVRELMWVDQ